MPFSLVLMGSKTKLNFHFVIDDYNYLSRLKVWKDIPIVVPLMFGANNVCKVLLVVQLNLFPGLGEWSLLSCIISIQSIFYFFL